MHWNPAEHIHRAHAGDPPLDYCLWPYEPPAAAGPDAWRSSALLYHSFEACGAPDRMIELCDALRRTVGPFRTVWGVKHADGKVSWEFYFYDYTRMKRRFSTAAFKQATSGILDIAAPSGDDHPYFMFSVEVEARHLSGASPVEQFDLYIGNPGSAVSSGICYGLTARGVEMRNFYFFFDAVRHAHDIREKIVSNGHVPWRRLNLDEILWPEMRRAQTIVVANKRFNDGLYFSRIPVDELLLFLDRLEFPRPLRDFAHDNHDRFCHLLFDVGYDYVSDPRGGLRYVKGSYYGLL